MMSSAEAEEGITPPPPPPQPPIKPSKTKRPVKTRRHSTIQHPHATRSTTSTLPLPLPLPSSSPPPVDYVSILCGLSAGVAQAGLFNPFDRALYLSVKNEVPFLTPSNFQNPYSGFFQSVGHRALSGGLYFPLEQFFMTVLIPNDNDNNSNNNNNTGAMYNFLAGTAAGSMNALIVNPISAIKYKSWGRDVNRGMVTETLEMLRKGGLRPFYNGLIPTILRDLVFGGCYTFLRFEVQYRLQLSPEYQWAANFIAATLATVASGPFNLARNVQYATKSRHVADTVEVVLQNFVQETRDCRTITEKLKHVQNRLRLGWGTARVAVGMSFGHYTYDKLHGMYEQAKEEKQQQRRRTNNHNNNDNNNNNNNHHHHHVVR